MTFEQIENEHWNNVQMKCDPNFREAPEEPELTQSDIADAMWDIQDAIDMIRGVCGKVGCQRCDYWDAEEGCTIKVKEWLS